MIPSSYNSDILKLTDQSGMTFVDFVADTKLTVFVVSHTINLTFTGKKKSVKDSTFDLLDFLSKVD